MGDNLANLPKFFKPAGAAPLIRLGRNHDGGYLVDARSVQGADGVVSLGISEDWSFEEDFRQRNPVPLYAFDASLRAADLRRRMERFAPLRRRLWRRREEYRHYLKFYTSYTTFFSGAVRHIEQYVGIDAELGTGEDVTRYIGFSRAMREIVQGAFKRPFFKIDIEGWEYRILDELVEHSDTAEGIVMEFHDVDLHLARIEEFVSRLPLRICHVHCNNSGPRMRRNIPSVIECTFTRHPLDAAAPLQDPYLQPLDMPNLKGRPEYQIVFE